MYAIFMFFLSSCDRYVWCIVWVCHWELAFDLTVHDSLQYIYPKGVLSFRICSLVVIVLLLYLIAEHTKCKYIYYYCIICGSLPLSYQSLFTWILFCWWRNQSSIGKSIWGYSYYFISSWCISKLVMHKCKLKCHNVCSIMMCFRQDVIQ